MGKYTANGKDSMLDELAGLITHAGLLEAQTPITGVIGEADDETFTKTSHGLTDGDLVILTEMTGGTGLSAGDAGNANEAARPYFVRDAAANTFKLSEKPAGTVAAFTADVTALTVTELVELSGGSPAYARKAIAFNAAAYGTVDDSTNGAVFDVAAGDKVSYAGGYSALSAGTLYAIDKVVEETFAGQGTYTLTDFDLDLLAA